MSDKPTADALARAILTALESGGHVGRHSAVHRAELQREMGVNGPDRTFRRAYNADACPVCVCEDGLFVPRRTYEIDDCIQYLSAHMSGKKLQHRANVLYTAYRHLMMSEFEARPLFGSEAGAETMRGGNDFHSRGAGI